MHRIDEQARLRDISGLLAQEESANESSGLFSQALRRMKWRREKSAHEALRLDSASPSVTGGNLTAEAKALMQQFTLFHQRRAAKPV